MDEKNIESILKQGLESAFLNDLVDPCGRLLLSSLVLQNVVNDFASKSGRLRHAFCDIVESLLLSIAPLRSSLEFISTFGSNLFGGHIAEELLPFGAFLDNQESLMIDLRASCRRPPGPRGVQLDQARLLLGIEGGFTKGVIAHEMNVSRMTLYRYLHDSEIIDFLPRHVSDAELVELTQRVKEIHSQYGCTFIQGALSAMNVVASRARIHGSLVLVDPVGTAQRFRTTIQVR
jgi:hypothetical protein